MVNIARNVLIMPKKSATDALKSSSKRIIQKTAEVTVDLIDNKIADRITKVSKKSQQNISETVTNENDKQIPKERYISRRKHAYIHVKGTITIAPVPPPAAH